jgi:hypothetical protein
MGGFAVRAQVAVALVALALLAPSAAPAAPRSGVSGQVRMDSCGVRGTRCDSHGVHVRVEIRKAASRQLVRKVRTFNGRFHVRLRPGRYRLKATAVSGNGAASASVRVRRNHFTVVVLRLHTIHAATVFPPRSRS